MLLTYDVFEAWFIWAEPTALYIMGPFSKGLKSVVTRWGEATPLMSRTLLEPVVPLATFQ